MGIRTSKLILQLIRDSSIPALSSCTENGSLILRRNRQNLGRYTDLYRSRAVARDASFEGACYRLTLRTHRVVDRPIGVVHECIERANRNRGDFAGESKLATVAGQLSCPAPRARDRGDAFRACGPSPLFLFFFSRTESDPAPSRTGTQIARWLANTALSQSVRTSAQFQFLKHLINCHSGATKRQGSLARETFA